MQPPRPVFAADPPLSTRECGDYMGRSSEWIRGAINKGVWVSGRVVKLEAETLTTNHRRTNRIYLDSFVAFLRAIGWKHIPTRSG